MIRSLRPLAGAALAALFCCIAPAHAQFPDRAVRIVVPSTAGGTADILARELGQRLAEVWGKPVVIENKPGGLGVVGAEALARAAPDGYTLAMLPSNHAINPIVMKDLPYDTFRDFAPVAVVAIAPGLLVVNPALEANNAKAAFDLAKANPGKYAYGSPVPLTAGHRSMELLKQAAGVDIRHVPYKGGAQAVTDTMGGHVQFLIISIPSVIGQVKAGKLKALGVTTLKRFEGLPDIPTLAESGFPGFESVEWYGLFAPAGVPPAILEKISADTQRVLREAALRDRMIALGAIAAPGGPRDLEKMLRGEYDRWVRLAPVVKLQAD